MSSKKGTTANINRKQNRLKQGALIHLLNVPLDVAFEIFKFLYPIDVLQLSRSSRRSRDILLSKSARIVWKSSLANIAGLPPCPVDMTEPQWTRLVFDKTCQVCCKKHVREVDWGLFVRICKECAKTHLCIRLATLATSDEALLMSLILTRLDTQNPQNVIYCTAEYAKVQVLYLTTTNLTERSKFVQCKRKLVETRQQSSKLGKLWAIRLKKERKDELVQMRENRFVAVQTKLIALGWGEDLKSTAPGFLSLRSHSLVNQPHILTNRGWSIIEPIVIEYMKKIRKFRIEREYGQVVRTRRVLASKIIRTYNLSQLPWSTVMPTELDFWNFPAIQSIIEQPVDVKVDEHTFSSAIPLFPDMIATWRESLVGRLALIGNTDNIDISTTTSEGKHETFRLATTVFECSLCNDRSFLSTPGSTGPRCFPLHWPRVLAHWCLTKSQDFPIFGTWKEIAWRSNILSVDIDSGTTMERLIRACGMDPTTTTADDMDRVNPRLACRTCAKGQSSFNCGSAKDQTMTSDTTRPTPIVPFTAASTSCIAYVFEWRNALRHAGDDHSHSPIDWYRLVDADALVLRNAETISKMWEGVDETRTDGYMNTLCQEAWSCVHCLATPQDSPPSTLGAVLLHLIVKHGITVPAIANLDYYRSPAAPEIYNIHPIPSLSMEITLS